MTLQPFLAHALVAGTAVAAACGAVGWFVVLRAQVFAGDALSHVAFAGALAALVAGVDLRIGLFASCVGFGLLLALLGRRGRADDVVTGNVFAWVLGLGALLLGVLTTSGSGDVSGVSVLFGSIFGLTAGAATVAAAVGAATLVAVAAVARPLLFASLDEAVAAAAGVPVRALGAGFLVLVGVTAGEATQAVGALLLLGLLAGPAAAAARLVASPYRSLVASSGLAVACTWAGLATAELVPELPPSSAILAWVVLASAAASTWDRLHRLRGGNHRGEPT